MYDDGPSVFLVIQYATADDGSMMPDPLCLIRGDDEHAAYVVTAYDDYFDNAGHLAVAVQRLHHEPEKR